MSLDPIPALEQSEERVRLAHAFCPRFYDAAIDPRKWVPVLNDLREILSVDIAQINIVRLDDVCVLQTFWSGATENHKRTYLEYAEFVSDPRSIIFSEHPFRPIHCRQVVSDQQWYESEIYKHLFQPFGYDYTMVYLAHDAAGDMAVLLGLVRRGDAKPFDDDDLAHLSLYVPHLRRSFEIMMQLMGKYSDSSVFAEVLDHIETAVLIVDRFADPRHVNRAARALLEEGLYLSDDRGRLAAATAEATERLRTAILEAGLAGLDGQSAPPVRFPLPGPKGTAPLSATISALSDVTARTRGLVPDGAAVGLFITDPRHPFESDSEHLQRIYGLTATETLILTELVTKGSTRRVAESTGRSYETVRKHVKIIRDKLGAKTQADLVRIVSETQ